MLIDQAPERGRAQVVMPFLNQLAEVDLAPALVAMRARVPLALVVAERIAGGRQRALLLGHYPPPARPSRRWAEQTMQEATRALEAHVRARPEQWLWMHRRWKRSVPAAAPARNPAARCAPLV
jgi:KDO2-lipid IV(A) lauroyltransferase